MEMLNTQVGAEDTATIMTAGAAAGKLKGEAAMMGQVIDQASAVNMSTLSASSKATLGSGLERDC